MIHSPNANIQLPNHELKNMPVMVMNSCTMKTHRGHTAVSWPLVQLSGLRRKLPILLRHACHHCCTLLVIIHKQSLIVWVS